MFGSDGWTCKQPGLRVPTPDAPNGNDPFDATLWYLHLLEINGEYENTIINHSEGLGAPALRELDEIRRRLMNADVQLRSGLTPPY